MIRNWYHFKVKLCFLNGVFWRDRGKPNVCVCRRILWSDQRDLFTASLHSCSCRQMKTLKKPTRSRRFACSLARSQPNWSLHRCWGEMEGPLDLRGFQSIGSIQHPASSTDRLTDRLLPLLYYWSHLVVVEGLFSPSRHPTYAPVTSHTPSTHPLHTFS